MAYGANTTYVTYRLLRGSLPLDLEVTPLVTYRSFHALASGQGWNIGVDPARTGRGRSMPTMAHAVLAALGPGRVPAGGSLVVGFPPPRGDRSADSAISGDLFAPGAFPRDPGTRRNGRAGLLDRAGSRSRRRASLAAAQDAQATLLAQADAETPIRSSSNSCSPPTSSSSPARCRTIPMGEVGHRRLPLVQRLGPRHDDRSARV